MRGRAHLYRRFPGIGRMIGEAVAAFADHSVKPATVRAWTDIQPERPYDPLPSPWVAWVHAKALDGTTWRFPVIPDACNPRPGGLVEADDKPYLFQTLAECEAEAAMARDALEASLFQLLRHDPRST